MKAKIIDGKAVAKRIREEMAEEIVRLNREQGVTPGLAVVLVGEDPASKVYVNSKNKACKEIGIYSEQHSLPADVPEKKLLKLIERLNADDRIHGILVQLPLPGHIDEKKVLNKIIPEKDVDGFHPVNVGRLMIGEPGFRPCTPAGIQKLLSYSGVEIAGAHVVVVGRSNIVGKPIANMLLQKEKEANATVTVCHSRSRDLPALTRQADILIAAIGRPEMIGPGMVKPGAVVIDVGVNRVEDPGSSKGYRIVGDVQFEKVAEVCSLITPVPGGVGPMTITMLLYNTVESAKLRTGAGR